MLNHCRRTTPPPARREALRPRCACRWLVVLAACSVALCGCRTFGGRRGAISKSVADCRQLTDQGISSMERGDWKRAEMLLARAVEASPVDVEARRQYAEVLSHRGATQEALAQLEQARKQSATDPGAVRARRRGLSGSPATRRRGGPGRRGAGAGSQAGFGLDVARPGGGSGGQPAAGAGRLPSCAGLRSRRSPDRTAGGRIVPPAQPARAGAGRVAVAGRGLLTRRTAPAVAVSAGPGPAGAGRYDEAAQSLAQAAERDRPSPEILYQLAEVEWQAGHVAAAQATVQQALAMDPNHPGSRALSVRMASAPSPAGPRTALVAGHVAWFAR